VPPLLHSWEEFAGELAWGAKARSLADPSLWWWELRPHPVHGTLELRVPDAQTTIADAAGVIAFVRALCARLADQFDAGVPVPAPPSWRIAENRWSAARDGIEGTLADLSSGEPRPTRQRLSELVDDITPYAQRLGCSEQLRYTKDLIEGNGALRQREAAQRTDAYGLAAWLRERFLPDL
jgi:carboxylate-amine ligase